MRTVSVPTVRVAELPVSAGSSRRFVYRGTLVYTPGMATTTNSPRMVGYLRVSTDQQADSGLGIEAQRSAISAEAERRGWTVDFVTEIASGKRADNRELLIDTLDRLDRGDFDGIVVSRLDRLARSVLDFATIRSRAERRGWSVVALDVNVDTSTPSGSMMASVVAAFAEYERRIIGIRTSEALRRLREAGKPYGRPGISDTVRDRIIEAHRSGESLNAIARSLNADGVPTAQGGARWYPATVRKIVNRETVAA